MCRAIGIRDACRGVIRRCLRTNAQIADGLPSTPSAGSRANVAIARETRLTRANVQRSDCDSAQQSHQCLVAGLVLSLTTDDDAAADEESCHSGSGLVAFASRRVRRAINVRR